MVARPSLTRAPHATSERERQLLRFCRTVRHVPLGQLAARSRSLALRRLYQVVPRWPLVVAARGAVATRPAAPLPALPLALIVPDGIERARRRAAEVACNRFTYVGRTLDLSLHELWGGAHVSPLWTFNLQYLGALTDLVLAEQLPVARELLASWCAAYRETFDPVAWHPYPVSQRLINLCLAAEVAGDFSALGEGTVELTARHSAYLLSHLEYDLRGNHLLENACALLFAATHLQGPLAEACGASARHLLARELPTQVLADGAHFELSPMYHAIVLHRLLQVIALLGVHDPLVRNVVAPAARRMSAFLASILCPDGDLPLLGDSVRSYAPPPTSLLEAAVHYGVYRSPSDGPVVSHKASGLHVLRNQRLWAIFDAGPVCAPSLPGHGQADSLTVEVWCDGMCVVGDPGVHDYTGPLRAWGRSSRAHSTITVNDANTSEVYASFRVGGRAAVLNVTATDTAVEATIAPFGHDARLTRSMRLGGAGTLELRDTARIASGDVARSRLHLHPEVTLLGYTSPAKDAVVVRTPVGHVSIQARHRIEIEPARASRRYGAAEPTTILVQTLGPTAGAEVTASYAIRPVNVPARESH